MRNYFVFTWDTDMAAFTPQVGVPHGPLSLYELKLALKQLRSMGYSCHRFRDEDGNYDNNDPWVLVCDEENLERFEIKIGEGHGRPADAAVS